MINDAAADNTISGNTIIGNAGDGVRLDADAGSGNTISANILSNNGGLGIDLNADGVTGNDAGDADTGPNDLLNFPAITLANEFGGTVTVNYDLDVPAGDYHVEFFSNASGADATGYGEGETLVATATVAAHPGGLVTYNTTFAGLVGDVLTATTTEDTGAGTFGATSEFSDAATVLASAFTVNSTRDVADNDPGNGVCETGALNTAGAAECTLRAALEEVAASPIGAQVLFSMPMTEPGHSSGVWTISPTSELPWLTNTTIIDGSSQPGWLTTPVVEIDGSALAGAIDAINIDSTAVDTVVRELAIVNYPDDAIWTRANDTILVGNHLGVRPDGTTPAPNKDGVVVLGGAQRAVIGGPNPADANVISGNADIRNPHSRRNDP